MDAEPWHEQYVHDAVEAVLGLFEDDHVQVARLAEELAAAPDARLARGAARLRGILDEVKPVFGRAI